MWTFLAKVENVDLFADNCSPTVQTLVPKARTYSRGVRGHAYPEDYEKLKAVHAFWAYLGLEMIKFSNKKVYFFHFFKQHMILRECSPIKRREGTKFGILPWQISVHPLTQVTKKKYKNDKTPCYVVV